MKESRRPKIGLALGSGGSRGLAHIGVIKVLEENNIPIDFIAGSSIGSMVGGFYAAGLDVKKMEEIVSQTDWRRMFSLVDPHLDQGLIGGEKVKAFFDDYVGGKAIEDCGIPFVSVATDIKTGEAVVHSTGDLSQAIRASISIPLVFKPVQIDGKTLADGGLSAPVPVEIARAMGADIVIAVNLDKHYHEEKSRANWFDIANDALGILRHNLALSNVQNADIVINIDLGKNFWYEFTNGKEKILVGEKATRDTLPSLQHAIAQKTKKKHRSFLSFLRA